MSNYEIHHNNNRSHISEVPEGWKLKRLKYLTKSKKELSETGEEELLSVTETRGIIKRKELKSDDEPLSRSDDLIGYRLVEEGNLVNNIMLVWKRGLGVSPYSGIVSPAYSVFSFSKECDPWYFNYLLRSEEYITEFRRNSTGITMSRLRLYDDSFGDVFGVLPPLNEQKIISRYLDKKTSQIDKLISKIKKRIELLKEQRTSLINQYVTKGLDPNVEMKDSGVEWIGEIPRHWEMRKITHATTLIGSGTTPKSDNEAYYLDGATNWLVTGDLNDGYVIQTSSKVTEKALKDHSSLKLYPTGSLLMAMYGATIGKLGILKVEVTVNQATCVMNFNENNSVEFWFNVLFGNRNYIVSLGYGGGQPNISQGLIKSLRFPCPPTIKEQLEIVEAIKSRIGKHDSVIQMEHKRLLLSKEYRQSFISSVVTGKVRVTEEMI